MADEQANQAHDFPRQYFAACARPNGSKTFLDFAAPSCYISETKSRTATKNDHVSFDPWESKPVKFHDNRKG